jgi:hypothetical protein
MLDEERPEYFIGFGETRLDSYMWTVGAPICAGIDSNAQH